MEISIVLAKILGLYLTLTCILMLIAPTRFQRLMQSIINHHGLISLSGFIALIFGIVIISIHSVWIFQWPIVITLLGWLMIIQGIIRIVYPELTSKMSKYLIKPSTYFSVAVVWLLIGVYLLYHGFF